MSDTNENANAKPFYPEDAVVRPLSKVLRGLPRPNSEAVGENQKTLWRKQVAAMKECADVLGERIKNLIDNE